MCIKSSSFTSNFRDSNTTLFISSKVPIIKYKKISGLLHKFSGIFFQKNLRDPELFVQYYVKHWEKSYLATSKHGKKKIVKFGRYRSYTDWVRITFWIALWTLWKNERPTCIYYTLMNFLINMSFLLWLGKKYIKNRS